MTAGTTAVFSHCRQNLLQCDCPGSQRRTDGSRPPKTHRNLLFHQYPQRAGFKDSVLSGVIIFLCVWLHSADRRCVANGSSSTAHFIIRIYPVGEFYWPLSALNAEAAALYMPVYLSTTGIQGSYWWACNTNIQPRKAATERMDVRTCVCVSSEVVSTCERC